MYAYNKLYFAKSGYVLFVFLIDALLLSQRLLVRGTLRFTNKSSKLALHAHFEKHVVCILSICLCLCNLGAKPVFCYFFT